MRPTPTPELATLLDAAPEQVAFLRSSQNHVYEFRNRAGRAKILRLTPWSHRSRAELQDELEWLTALHDAGLSVCPPFAFPDGTFLQDVTLPEGHFFAATFAQAPGRLVTRGDLGPELYTLHGRILGQLHAFSARHADRFLARRKRWDEERYFCEDLETFIPAPVRDEVRQTWRQLQGELRELASGPSAPMHLDLGYSNFHRDGDRLHVFDFDNCALAPRACDIALALYGSLFNLPRCEFPGDRAAFEHPRTSQNLADVLPAFRAGYETEHPWPAQDMEHLALWLEFSYIRSVVHAFRMQHPVTNPRIQEALDKDIDNVLRRQPPVRCGYSAPQP